MTAGSPRDDQGLDELPDAHEALEEAARAVLEATAAAGADTEIEVIDDDDDDLVPDVDDSTAERTGSGDGLVHSALAELRAIAGTPESETDDA